MVQGKGGAPRGRGTVAFWTERKEEWNKKHPNHRYKTWKGVKATYDRITKKLKGRFQVAPAPKNQASQV